jgi:signal peptidase I
VPTLEPSSPSPSTAESDADDLSGLSVPESAGDGGALGAIRSIVQWVAVILAALVIALAVKTFLFQAFAIPSASMEPTLRNGDRVIVSKLSSDLSDLDRGDVIVFERPAHPSVDPSMQHLIKRIVGMPGDELSSVDGAFHVNGAPLEEPYLRTGTRTDDLTPLTVPDGHVFVMGDNRGSSGDSRKFGAIPAELVVGRAFVRVWPLGDFGGL